MTVLQPLPLLHCKYNYRQDFPAKHLRDVDFPVLLISAMTGYSR